MKLTYFAVRGRAEPARLMLELAGAPYEFEPISVEDWRGGGKARMLEATPFGQMPLLTDGSFVLCQSGAINRYLAAKFDLLGETLEERARVDEVAETAGEVIFELSKFHWEPRFTEQRAPHRDTTATRLAHVDTYFKRVRVDPQHWVLPTQYTLGDVMMAYALETTLPLHPGLLDGFPDLYAFMMAFFSTPEFASTCGVPAARGRGRWRWHRSRGSPKRRIISTIEASAYAFRRE